MTARTWTLPKGTPKRGETTEETALREVAEETGLEVRITGTLDSIQYVFVQSGTRIHKTVHYFLMEPTGGDLAGHDHEFEEVRWIDFDEAPRVLSFETERALVAHAADVLGRGGDRRRPWPRRGDHVTEPTVDPAPTVHDTPLVDRHLALGARLIDFAGWRMPVQYTSILEEHKAVRERAGLFDLSHMGELWVEGPGGRQRPSTRPSSAPPAGWPSGAPSTR